MSLNHSIDTPTREVTDKVIAEVRAIKRAISERHGNDIDRLLASLMAQERSSGVGQTGRGSQDAVAPHSGSERPS